MVSECMLGMNARSLAKTVRLLWAGKGDLPWNTRQPQRRAGSGRSGYCDRAAALDPQRSRAVV